MTIFQTMKLSTIWGLDHSRNLRLLPWVQLCHQGHQNIPTTGASPENGGKIWRIWLLSRKQKGGTLAVDVFPSGNRGHGNFFTYVS